MGGHFGDNVGFLVMRIETVVSMNLSCVVIETRLYGNLMTVLALIG